MPTGNSEKVIAGADGVNGLTLSRVATTVRGKISSAGSQAIWIKFRMVFMAWHKLPTLLEFWFILFYF